MEEDPHDDGVRVKIACNQYTFNLDFTFVDALELPDVSYKKSGYVNRLDFSFLTSGVVDRHNPVPVWLTGTRAIAYAMTELRITKTGMDIHSPVCIKGEDLRKAFSVFSHKRIMVECSEKYVRLSAGSKAVYVEVWDRPMVPIHKTLQQIRTSIQRYSKTRLCDMKILADIEKRETGLNSFTFDGMRLFRETVAGFKAGNIKYIDSKNIVLMMQGNKTKIAMKVAA